MALPRQHIIIYGFFVFALFLNIAVWLSAREMRTQWLNVPPVPREEIAASIGLGDSELAYRVIAIMLQNLGESGGRSVSFKKYDYNRLVRWFMLENKLNPRSSYIPYIAAFYFGAVNDPEKIKPLVEYLRFIGNKTQGQNWRWLAHAVYLARFTLNDLDEAYEIALELANHQGDGLPPWTRQMPAFIMYAQGDKETAYEIIMEILKEEGDTLPAEEINALRDYVCKRILDAARAGVHPLCQGH